MKKVPKPKDVAEYIAFAPKEVIRKIFKCVIPVDYHENNYYKTT